jgi:D-glycero-alpha-D-manno-heptose-7-phosphate kinase
VTPPRRCAVARTPLRLPLGGGGTDLPFYAHRYGGDVLSVAITLFVTVVATRGRIDGQTRFSHERTVVVADPDRFPQPYVREAVRMVGADHPLDIASLGPVPAGTGLGSSGAFAVSLLAVLHALEGSRPDPKALVEQACTLEMERVGRPAGKQDQYVCGLGGVRRIVVEPSGPVRLPDVGVSPATLDALEERLLLLYTGRSRDSAAHLGAPPAPERLARRVEQLHRIKEIGHRIRPALQAGDLDQFAALLHEHWTEKRRCSGPGPWDGVYEAARSSGAAAGKLVGAGGGGFLLLYVHPARRPAVLRVAREHDLTPVAFGFEHRGTRLTLLPDDCEGTQS